MTIPCLRSYLALARNADVTVHHILKLLGFGCSENKEIQRRKRALLTDLRKRKRLPMPYALCLNRCTSAEGKASSLFDRVQFTGSADGEARSPGIS